MKSKIKVILLSVLMLLFMSNVSALTKTDYIKVDGVGSLKVDNLTFENLSFKDYSKTSTQAIGIVGTVKNSGSTVNYVLRVNYYDANKNLLFETANSKTSLNGNSSFSHTSNLDVLNGHSISEIKYYVLSIDITGTSVKKDYTPSQISEYQSRGYVIDKYDINMIVNEDGTFDIEENITAYFNEQRHGIIRSIPLKNFVERLDGSTYSNKVRVTDLNVNDNYSTSRENGIYNIKIGSADTTITGKKDYQIKYKYRLSNDKNKNYDELYFNIIGDKWDTVIGNISFTITMPKEFDASKLGFSSGSYGSVENDNIKYSIDGNVIKGYYDGILGSNEALTVRCELPEGYFIKPATKLGFKEILVFIIPIIFVVVAIYLWKKYGKDDQVIETVEFYPPEGMNSLNLAYAYKGSANDKDIVSLLIYLANKGYIKITENEKKSIFGKKGFEIEKLKNYDGFVHEEELFMDGLFKNKDIVTKSDLECKFYKTIDIIKRRIMSEENKYSLFEKKASKKIFPLILMIMAIYGVITVSPLKEYGAESGEILFGILFPMVGFSIALATIFGKSGTIYVNGVAIKSKILSNIFGIGFGLMFGLPVWLGIILPAIIDYPLYIAQYIVGVVAAGIIAICIKYMPKRTPYGNKILGQIRGFKNFLETAEKEKLETLVEENPTYFYDILPYTYVLGISKKWIKKFESIAIQPPVWYAGYDTFDYYMFSSFMDDTISSAERVMTSVPQSSGGSGGFSSGSSGGGFSGGGSGGGGGSSW